MSDTEEVHREKIGDVVCLRGCRAPRAAFTLVEILVASAIFFAISSLTVVIFYRATAVSQETFSSIEMAERAHALTSLLQMDLTASAPTTGFYWKSEPGGSYADLRLSTVFMGTLPLTASDYGGKGSSAKAIINPRRNHAYGMIWVRWQVDHETGEIQRAQSRRLYNDKIYLPDSLRPIQELDKTAEKDRNHFSNRAPTPQREMVYLFGNGTTRGSMFACLPGDQRKLTKQRDTGVTPAAGLFGWAPFQHRSAADPRENWDASDDDTAFGDARFARSDPALQYEILAADFVMGTEGKDEIDDDVYGVRNPGGFTFNKDLMNLDGHPNAGDLYPEQALHVAENVEFFVMIPFDETGTNFIENYSDHDSLNDPSSSDYAGYRVPLQGAGMVDRPSVWRVAFLLHDLDQSDQAAGQTPLIDTYRQRALDQIGATGGNAYERAILRQATLRDIIRENGGNAQVFTMSIEVPR